MAGIRSNLGGSIALTLKVLSSKKEDRAIAASVSGIPMSKERKFGRFENCLYSTTASKGNIPVIVCITNGESVDTSNNPGAQAEAV